MKRLWKLGSLICLSLWACQPTEPVVTPSPVPSSGTVPTPSPEPEPVVSTSPSPTPSTTPQPSPSPSSTPQPTSEPTPSPEPIPTQPPPVEPLLFGEIKVITGDGSSGLPESGTRAESMPFPELVSGIISDKDHNIWLLNRSEGRLGYITSLISRPSSSQTLEYRLYWERIRDLQSPMGMVYDDQSGLFYVVETYQNQVSRIDPNTGIKTPVAGTGYGGYNGDGPALECQLNLPEGLALDNAGNLYIADTGNHLIRKVTPDGQMQTVAGQYIQDTHVEDEDDVPSFTPEGATTGDGGPALQARLNSPRHLAVSPDGSTLYITGAFQTIRQVRNGLMEHLAGSGNTGYNGEHIPAQLAHLNQPTAMAIGPDGLLYFIDSNNLRVRRVRPTGAFSIVETVAGSGSDQAFATARTDALTADIRPRAITFDPLGNLWIYDQAHRRLRQLERDNESHKLSDNTSGENS